MDEPVNFAQCGRVGGLGAKARSHAPSVQPVGRGNTPVVALVNDRQGLITGAPSPLELDLEMAARRLHHQDNRPQRVFHDRPKLAAGFSINPEDGRIGQEFREQGPLVRRPFPLHPLGLCFNHSVGKRGDHSPRGTKLREDAAGDLSRAEEVASEGQVRLLACQRKEFAKRLGSRLQALKLVMNPGMACKSVTQLADEPERIVGGIALGQDREAGGICESARRVGGNQLEDSLDASKVVLGEPRAAALEDKHGCPSHRPGWLNSPRTGHVDKS